MGRIRIYIYIGLAILVLSLWKVFTTTTNEEGFSERVKISLREVGNQLLLADQDSTSVVLPVKELSGRKFELSFETKLSFLPDSLVAIVDRSLKKTSLQEDYRVEVIECTAEEVAYSYQMTANVESTIIPCRGRTLPHNCYIIQVGFTSKASASASNRKNQVLWLILLLGVILLLAFLLNKRNQKEVSEKEDAAYATIGRYKFYQEQNKLVKEAEEISLSKKECELLAIFVERPNEVIQRDELTKKVWEDNGVIVGRSLDTYISKLRKKLKEDTAIKITNVHGVGYKLEINTETF